MNTNTSLRLYVLVNPGAGNQELDWEELINDFYKDKDYTLHFFVLTKKCSTEQIKQDISEFDPHRLLAVGGDGTVKLAAECLLGTNVPLAIIPAGSANGMAKEINLKTNIKAALELAATGTAKSIHALLINGELSIHLADIGMNARIVKKFQSLHERGMTGYMKAAWQVLKRHKKMHVTIRTQGKSRSRKADMVVIANGTSYGTGLKINKCGSLFDTHFEVVVVKWRSVLELLSMCLRFKASFNPFKTETVQTDQVTLSTRENTFLQVDGEYIGKVKHVEAKLIPQALSLICNIEEI
ncbi:diacylglycerol kinase family protein [Olivibacter sp. XZL3]|uniref:diacylglycerol/lipid kinase family protein n=1 Tax=Olivibacter sp. XZL3 TaxID=1735116 RepID=UPI001066A6EA|nr:diacylglycerol kinase family protein [Olivibacter sp. XZL3]